MSIFTPDIMLASVTQIDKVFLVTHQIKGLILDVDNTLTRHGSQQIRPEIRIWLSEMKKLGVKLTIASNNTMDRVKPFAESLDLDFVAMSCKPLPIGLSVAQNKFSLPKEQIALVGDQIYTDIVGGNLKGFLTIMVAPFAMEDGLLFKMKRSMEGIHIRGYEKKKAAAQAAQAALKKQKSGKRI